MVFLGDDMLTLTSTPVDTNKLKDHVRLYNNMICKPKIS